jgi:hypothetical protein
MSKIVLELFDDIYSAAYIIFRGMLETMWNEAVMTHFKVLSQRSAGVKENRDIHRSGWPVSGPNPESSKYEAEVPTLFGTTLSRNKVIM